MADMIGVIGDCPFCRKEVEVKVPLEGFLNWRQGELVQKAFPHISATTREFLISGICPTCQDKVFGEA